MAWVQNMAVLNLCQKKNAELHAYVFIRSPVDRISSQWVMSHRGRFGCSHLHTAWCGADGKHRKCKGSLDMPVGSRLTVIVSLMSHGLLWLITMIYEIHTRTWMNRIYPRWSTSSLFYGIALISPPLASGTLRLNCYTLWQHDFTDNCLSSLRILIHDIGGINHVWYDYSCIPLGKSHIIFSEHNLCLARSCLYFSSDTTRVQPQGSDQLSRTCLYCHQQFVYIYYV